MMRDRALVPRVGRVADTLHESASRGAESHEQFVTVSPRVWKVGFVAGALVWSFSAVITELTNDDILVPTVIILGSFLVPGTLSAFALSRKRGGYLTAEEVVLAFFMAGTRSLCAFIGSSATMRWPSWLMQSPRQCEARRLLRR